MSRLTFQIGAHLSRVLITHVRVFLEGLSDDFSEPQRQIGIQVQGRGGLVMKNGIENDWGGIAGKRHPTSGHLVQHCAIPSKQ